MKTASERGSAAKPTTNDENNTKLARSENEMKKTGNEKKGYVPPPKGVGQDEWDHRKAGTQDWQWVSLTDSFASKYPPIFTKDGRCAFLVG